jgi:UDP-GlcNAc:undecaprenyl-phosphate GlcNAc-1-phosphate transferase
MLTLLLLLSCSCLLCCLLTPLAGLLASRCNLVDRPDARRKLHGRSIPLAGGLAVLLSGCVVLGGAFLIANPLQEFLVAGSSSFLGLFVAAALICGLGVLDDFNLLRGRHKLLGQIVAAGVVIAFGVRVDRVEVFGHGFEMGILALPFTLFWLLGAINSINLLDGMDGMLGCVGFILSLALAGMAVLQGQWAMACVAATLAGTLLGFLCWNLPPASVFLGDAGSMLVGLTIGVVAIQTSLKGTATAVMIAPLGLLTIPFLDTAAALVRRKLTGRSIYSTDRGHLHHCMLRRGLSVRVVLALVSLFATLTVVGALASLALKNEIIAVLTTMAVVCVLIATRLFGHSEYELIRQRLGRLVSSFTKSRADRPPMDLEIHLQGTNNWGALMEAVTGQAETLNLRMVSLDVSAPALHEQYHARWRRSEEKVDEVQWRAEVPLLVADRLVGSLLVSGSPDGQALGVKVAALCRLIEEYQRNGCCKESMGRWRKEHAASIYPEVAPWQAAPVQDIPVGTGSSPTISRRGVSV